MTTSLTSLGICLGARNVLTLSLPKSLSVRGKIILGAVEIEAKSILLGNQEHNEGNPTIRMWFL